MELDYRKGLILKTIVEHFIKTGEPVGSKTLSVLLDGVASPATIRNEMAALFELGLLEQPHTSAGRVPTHLGYRVYIDRFMQPKPLAEEEKNEIDALFNLRDPDPDRILEVVSSALAELTGCAVISSTITPKSAKVKKINVLPIDRRTVLVVVTTNTGVVKTNLCRLDFSLNKDILAFFVKFVNDRFGDKSLDEITAGYVKAVTLSLSGYADLFTGLLVTIYDICAKLGAGEYHVDGDTNLLAYEQFSGVAYGLLNLLKRQNEINGLISDRHDGINIIIGRENTYEELRDSSVLISKYPLGENTTGALGVIGPVRIDYSTIIPHIEYFSERLQALIKDIEDEEWNFEDEQR